MSDLVILGTDTDAGKTIFGLLWMAAFADEFEYWKPLETGEPDSATIRRLVPKATVHPPLLSFELPVAPLLAARAKGIAIPSSASIIGARPVTKKSLIIETFGGPLSPLNDDELQIELIRALRSPCVLVASSAVGAVGRSLQCLEALACHGIIPSSVALIGNDEPFAVEQIQRHWKCDHVYSLQATTTWDPPGIAKVAHAAKANLHAIRAAVHHSPLTTHHSPPTTHHSPLTTRDRHAVWHPYTSLGDAAEPLECVGAQDEFLYVASPLTPDPTPRRGEGSRGGRRVIDAISSWWTILHGHRHPVLMKALEDTAREFDHVQFAGVTHEPAVELAELILQSMPWKSGRVFYSDNGSTAVEVALKMAYQFWRHRGELGRTRFVGFEGGYHGDTFGAMAVGRDPVFFGAFEPLLFKASIVPVSAERLEAELKSRRGEVAAIIIEPLVQGAGGMRMHTPEVLRELAEVARRHEVLFIADEVMTGGFRTGTLWAHQAAGIAPDLICAGKTLAGGVLPLAATIAGPHVVAAFESDDPHKTFFHGHSFTAHPLACAVGVANWNLLLPMEITRDAPKRMEKFWRESLSPLAELPQVRDVRVRGSIAAVELSVDGGYLASVGRQIRDICLRQDVLLRPLGNVVYAMPPLGTSGQSLARIAEAMRAGVTEARC